jgi:hypothetical protein
VAGAAAICDSLPHTLGAPCASPPITKNAVLLLAAATLAPIAPLALTMMPLDELLTMLFGILF